MARHYRIVLTTFGSLGDLHPYMALALELQRRGHRPVLATGRHYKGKIESEGIEFAAVRPDFPDRRVVKKLVHDVMKMRSGPETVIRRVVLPHLRDSYEDLTRVVSGADLLITHMLTYAGPIVADKTRMLWVSTALQPSALVSLYDAIEWAPAPWLTTVRRAAPLIYRELVRLLIRSTQSWAKPIYDLRMAEGLAPPRANPLFTGSQSPYLVLALFSRLLCPPMPDWPANTLVTGFPFYDRNGEELDPAIAAFLHAGPPPIIFTLGSSAVMDAGRFYHDSLEAAGIAGFRALLLVGDEPENRPEATSDVGIFPYAPYSEVFPYCAAIVHQGGVGTTGQAMRAGRPMLVMPYGQDQPDNAARIVRLGIGRTIQRTHYAAGTAARELNALLHDASYSSRAAVVGRMVQEENGLGSACDAMEELLERAGPH